MNISIWQLPQRLNYSFFPPFFIDAQQTGKYTLKQTDRLQSR